MTDIERTDAGRATPDHDEVRPGLVSVIVPCHDRLPELAECLASMAAQTYPDMEAILVDDASTGDVAGVAERVDWRGRPWRLVRLGENRGPGAARERGRQLARGEFLAYLDSDDLWLPEKTARQVAALRDRPDAGMCYGRTMGFRPEGDGGRTETGLRSELRLTRFLPGLLTARRPWHTSACLWRRAATDRIGPWLPAWTWEDYEYDCRAGCLDVGIVPLDDVLCLNRRSPGNRLSVTRGRRERRFRERAPAALAMHSALAGAAWLDDDAVRRRMTRVLFDSGLALYRSGDAATGARCLSRVRETTGPLSLQGWIARAVLRRRRPWATRAAVRLAFILRRHVVLRFR